MPLSNLPADVLDTLIDHIHILTYPLAILHALMLTNKRLFGHVALRLWEHPIQSCAQLARHPEHAKDKFISILLAGSEENDRPTEFFRAAFGVIDSHSFHHTTDVINYWDMVNLDELKTRDLYAHWTADRVMDELGMLEVWKGDADVGLAELQSCIAWSLYGRQDNLPRLRRIDIPLWDLARYTQHIDQLVNLLHLEVHESSSNITYREEEDPKLLMDFVEAFQARYGKDQLRVVFWNGDTLFQGTSARTTVLWEKSIRQLWEKLDGMLPDVSDPTIFDHRAWSENGTKLLGAAAGKEQDTVDNIDLSKASCVRLRTPIFYTTRNHWQFWSQIDKTAAMVASVLPRLTAMRDLELAFALCADSFQWAVDLKMTRQPQSSLLPSSHRLRMAPLRSLIIRPCGARMSDRILLDIMDAFNETLEVLHIEGFPFDIHNLRRVIEEKNRFPRLRECSINLDCQSSVFVHLILVHRMPNLYKLSLSEGSSYPENLPSLWPPLLGLRRLRSLSLNLNMTVVFNLESFRRMQELEELMMTGPRKPNWSLVRDADGNIGNMGEVEYDPETPMLTLIDGHPFPNASQWRTWNWYMPCLRKLVFQGYPASMFSFVALNSFPCLEVLYLDTKTHSRPLFPCASANDSGDDTQTKEIPTSTLTHLKTLCLSGAWHVTVTSLDTLLKHICGSKLLYLSLDGCYGSNMVHLLPRSLLRIYMNQSVSEQQMHSIGSYPIGYGYVEWSSTYEVMHCVLDDGYAASRRWDGHKLFITDGTVYSQARSHTG